MSKAAVARGCSWGGDSVGQKVGKKQFSCGLSKRHRLDPLSQWGGFGEQSYRKAPRTLEQNESSVACQEQHEGRFGLNSYLVLTCEILGKSLKHADPLPYT